jgi:hypothetical protein
MDVCILIMHKLDILIETLNNKTSFIKKKVMWMHIDDTKGVFVRPGEPRFSQPSRILGVWQVG